MGKKQLKNLVSEAANIPKDVVFGVPLIRLVGQEELYIENYRGILEYADTLIRIQTKIGQIQVSGRKLEVIYYSNEEMKVVGFIERVEYYQGGLSHK